MLCMEFLFTSMLVHKNKYMIKYQYLKNIKKVTWTWVLGVNNLF